MESRADAVNIRERVQAIGKEMLAGDPTPSEARNNEIILSGLLAHINKAATASEVAYKKKFAELRRTCDSAATAKIEAEATQEYEEFLEAEATSDSAKHMLRTLGNFTRSLSEELRLQR